MSVIVLFTLRLAITILTVITFIFLASCGLREIFKFTSERNYRAWWSFPLWAALGGPWVLLGIGITIFLIITMGAWTFHAIP